MLDWFSYMLKKKKTGSPHEKASYCFAFFVGFVSLQMNIATNWSRGKKKRKGFCSQEHRSIDLVECNDFPSSCQFLSVLLPPPFFSAFIFSWKIETDCCHGKEVVYLDVLIYIYIMNDKRLFFFFSLRLG